MKTTRLQHTSGDHGAPESVKADQHWVNMPSKNLVKPKGYCVALKCQQKLHMRDEQSRDQARTQQTESNSTMPIQACNATHCTHHSPCLLTTAPPSTKAALHEPNNWRVHTGAVLDIYTKPIFSSTIPPVKPSHLLQVVGMHTCGVQV